MPISLTVGEWITPRGMHLSPQNSHYVLPYKARCVGLVHQVFRYSSWVDTDCVQWAAEPFMVLANTVPLTCLWCVAMAVHRGL